MQPPRPSLGAMIADVTGRGGASVSVLTNHPEQLLVNNGDIIRKILHVPIDRAEKKGFQKTNRILCNSQFTSNVI